jgi:triacylglycerol esterase/lipase EstA (alpha/beta hydrolase family)
MILKQSYTDTCIVYAHGLGSNKLEVLPVAQYFLELGFNVCAFDFSGSGRSEGEHTTYGVR